MKRSINLYLGVTFAVLAFSVAVWQGVSSRTTAASETGDTAPSYKVDPFWPKPLPHNWILGQVAGVAVDSRDHIWIVQRPGSLTIDEAGAAQDPPVSECCVPAPPVIELDADGNVVSSWGGPGEGFEWPNSEHGIFVDYKDNVWIAGNGENDHQVLKFTRDGKFLLQIGEAGKTSGSNHTSHLGLPADTEVDPETNEVYIADGYLNKRVIVFDADSGAYKRHWGAYGNKPDDADPGPYDPDAPAAKQFRSPVHGLTISKDGHVYVADRVNNRIQVFQKDGTFVEEVVIAKKTLGNGSAWDVELSKDDGQSYLYDADGTNQKIWMLMRQNLQTLGAIGRRGQAAGEFHWVHNVAVDSEGSVYTAEVDMGKRAQRFVRQASSSE